MAAVPDHPRFRAWPPLTAAVVLLVLGGVVAWGIGGALGLSFTPAAVPVEIPVAAPARPDAPTLTVTTIAVPPGPRTALAAAAVADAIAARGGARPEIVTATGDQAPEAGA